MEDGLAAAATGHKNTPSSTGAQHGSNSVAVRYLADLYRECQNHAAGLDVVTIREQVATEMVAGLQKLSIQLVPPLSPVDKARFQDEPADASRWADAYVRLMLLTGSGAIVSFQFMADLKNKQKKRVMVSSGAGGRADWVYLEVGA